VLKPSRYKKQDAAFGLGALKRRPYNDAAHSGEARYLSPLRKAGATGIVL
jgi:hypothetical protein